MDIHFLKRLPLRNLKTEVDFRFYGRHLEKSIWRHNSDASRRIATKFGRLKQNHMRRTKHRSRSKSTTHGSKLKQEIEFQHGDRPFSKTVSSFISTVDWDISSNFGMHIDFHHFEQSLNLNSEVDFRLHDRHVEKSIWRQKFGDVFSDYDEISQAGAAWLTCG